MTDWRYVKRGDCLTKTYGGYTQKIYIIKVGCKYIHYRYQPDDGTKEWGRLNHCGKSWRYGAVYWDGWDLQRVINRNKAKEALGL